MAKAVGVTNPQALLDRAILQVLVDVFPEVQAIHATLFSLAAEGGYTFEEAAAETGESEATLRAAFNELGDLGLAQLTPELDLTDEGNKLLDDALEAAQKLLGESIQH